MDDPEIIIAPDPEAIDFMRETFRLFEVAAERDRRRAGLPVVQPSVSDLPQVREYMTIKQLAAYSGFSVRRLQDWTRDAVDPLPKFAPGGGKAVYKRAEFDSWLSRRRAREEQGVSVVAVVDDVLSQIKGGK